MTAKSAEVIDKTEKTPPRERILAAAAGLFYRNGIRAVGVDAIAEAAGTNKMTLYRHFSSKDELVAEYLRQAAKGETANWERLQAQHPGDALAQLRAWLKDTFGHVVSRDERGCPLVNAAVELPDKDHPARRVIEECKVASRARVIGVCRAAGLKEPELLADELNLMLEGARVTAQSMGPEGLAARLKRISEALIAAHMPK
jgi:AcrR family transcriptional regulator